MKRSPLKRKTQLKSTPMRRSKKSWGAGRQRRGPSLKSQRTKYARRERDYERMGWTRTLSCALLSGPGRAGEPRRPVAFDLWPDSAHPDPCSGPIEAHHAGVHGMSNKAPDATVFPVCRHHHACLTGKPGGRGCFDGWPRGSVKAWELAVVTFYQTLYAARAVEDAPALY